VNEEASDKVLEVEQKYNEIRRPVYNKRNDIIHNIPDFWLTAFLSHPVLSDLLTDEDQKVFKYLDSLDVEDFKDVKSGYSINFVSALFLKHCHLILTAGCLGYQCMSFTFTICCSFCQCNLGI
jgi:hypothetical protein